MDFRQGRPDGGGVTLVPLANGGTNADLSATGGASKFLKQASTGAAITVAQPAFTDLTGAATVAQGAVPSFTSQGQGYFWSLDVSDAGIGGTATIISPTGNNVVCVFQFVLPYAITVSRIVFAKGGTVVAGSHANFGIYDMSRNRLIDSGQFDTSSGGASVQSNSITAVPLLPGAFYFAQAATDSTVTCALNAQNITVSVMSTFRNQNSPANNARQGTAANALSGGILPSSLGNITAFANRAPVGILFEP